MSDTETGTWQDGLDLAVLRRARQLADLGTPDQAGPYFADLNGADSIAARYPLGAYFGASTAILGDLLSIIGRQADELTHTRDQVRLLADQLAEEKAKNRRG